MTEKLLRFNNKQKYLVFDAETEGLNLISSRPWEIGYILCEGKKIVKTHKSYLWWPDLQVSEEAARITRFDYYKYESEANDPREEFLALKKYILDPNILIVGQNILNFDCFIFNILAKEVGDKIDYSWVDRILDTRALAVAIQKGAKSFDWSDPFCWQMRYMNHKERGIKASLSALMKYYNLPYDPMKHHDAIEDVKMTFDVFNKQIWELDI